MTRSFVDADRRPRCARCGTPYDPQREGQHVCPDVAGVRGILLALALSIVFWAGVIAAAWWWAS